MIDTRQRIGIGIAVGLAVAALAAVLFVPGIGCGNKDVKNIHGQANKRAVTRHKYDSLTQYLEQQRKIARAKKAKQDAADNAATKSAKSPRQLTTYRTSVAMGVWQRFIWSPSKRADNNTLTSGKRAIALKAVVSLNRRLELVIASAKDARLTSIANAASAARHDLGEVTATLSSMSFDPKIMASENALMNTLMTKARKSGLKVMPSVPGSL